MFDWLPYSKIKIIHIAYKLGTLLTICQDLFASLNLVYTSLTLCQESIHIYVYSYSEW